MKNNSLGPLVSKFKNATDTVIKQYSLAYLLLPDFSNQLPLLIIIFVSQLLIAHWSYLSLNGCEKICSHLHQQGSIAFFLPILHCSCQRKKKKIASISQENAVGRKKGKKNNSTCKNRQQHVF